MDKETNGVGKSIISSVKQLFLIVFSVVLGILLSEKIEENKNDNEAKLLLSKIKSEVNNNKQLLEYWTPYHSKIVKDLDSLIKDETFVNDFINDQSTLFSKVLTKGNLMGDFPSNDAWDIAKSHPLIVHFDYEDLLILSRIYNQQKMTYNSVPKIIDLFLSADFNSKEKAETNLKLFKNLLREIVSRETQLLRFFNDAEKTQNLQNS